MRVLLRLLLLGIALTIGPARALSQPAPPGDKESPASAGDPKPDAEPAATSDTDEDGETSKGTLVVTARSQKGGAIADVAVSIDNKPMGELDAGEVTLTNIPEGRHAIVIEARGYKKFEQSVMVREGERAKLDALLVAEAPRRKPALWKWTLGASIPMLVTGAAYGYHSRSRTVANRSAIVVAPAPNPDGGFYADPKPIQTKNCGQSAERIALEAHSIVVNQDRFDRMCTWRGRTFIAYGVGGVGLVAAFISIYMLTADRRADPVYSLDARRKSRDLAIVPTVSPDGGGALLSLAW
jgi:hypothetical protein